MNGVIAALATRNDAVERIGGKGRSLARLARAGFAVPAGFTVTADAYRQFVSENALEARIRELARPVANNGGPCFDAAAAAIGRCFEAVDLSGPLARSIRAAYAALPEAGAVAMRSSANAEDSDAFSFAGQHQTFLNVRGADAVIGAVKGCWASLWTARAMAYRHQHGIAQESASMAVVVQAMVAAEVSGIIFTANPVSGDRAEIVVNASYGLGSAVVGGEVAPDHFILDRHTLAIQQATIGAKAQAAVPDGDRGLRLRQVERSERGRACLAEQPLRELALTALDIEARFGGLPQDIEWAIANGKPHWLQSRPIVNLPVPPTEADWSPPLPAQIVCRRQIAENMPEPLSPLFEELYLTHGLGTMRRHRGDESQLVGGGPTFVTVNGYAYQRLDFPAFFSGDGERTKLVTDLDVDSLDYTLAQYRLKRFDRLSTEGVWRLLESRREGAAQDVALFEAELPPAERTAFKAWLQTQDGTPRSAVALPESQKLAQAALTHTADHDACLRTWGDSTLPALAKLRAKWAGLALASAPDKQLLDGIRELAMEEAYLWQSSGARTMATGKNTEQQLESFLRTALPGHRFTPAQFLSGIESPTRRAQADLFKIAQQVRASAALSELVVVTPAKFLNSLLRSREDGRALCDAIDAYLAANGHQSFNLDFVEPTLAEEPSALFASLQAMVANADYDPGRQAARSARLRTARLEELSALLDGLPYWQFRFRLWLARRYGHTREEVVFHFGFSWGVLRSLAGEIGRRLVAAGTLAQRDDVYFLATEELRRAMEARRRGLAAPDLGALAAERRLLREARKRHQPPPVIPAAAGQLPMRVFAEARLANDNPASAGLQGFPISPGRVTAPASVVRGPADFDCMTPGSILVCPLAIPAWTHLYIHAAGLVTDIGGILAHGSIIAREYGIPAVFGVDNATARIRHSQTLTVDGDAGTVTMHEDPR